MKKKLLSILLIAVLICSLSTQAFAAVSSGDVTFTKDGKMAEQNFNVDQVFAGLEPGDDATYTVNIHNQNSNLPVAAALSTVLMAIILVSMLILNKFSDSEEGGGVLI